MTSSFDELLGLPEPKLPGADDHLFAVREDWWNNACLNWSPGEWSLYADGYMSAADALVNTVEEKGGHQDTFVYPVLFLYRQFLELKLKELVFTLRRLLEEGREFPTGHRLDLLWQEAEQLFRRAYPEQMRDDVLHAGRLIRELSAVDKQSTAFRYPVDMKGEPSLPGFRHINLRNVREVMAKVAFVLKGIHDMAYEQLQDRLDWENEFRSDSPW